MLRTVPFYYLRHGQTDWNREGRDQGQQDIPLNDHGLLQAQHAASLLENEPITAIFSSPLSRARRTAEIVNEALRLPLTIIDDLTEIGFGEWEGTLKNHTDYAQWRAGLVAPHGAETFATFHERASSAINGALDLPGPVLIVGHGGLYWAIEHHAAFATKNTIPNATPVLHMPPDTGNAWTRRILASG